VLIFVTCAECTDNTYYQLAYISNGDLAEFTILKSSFPVPSVS